MLEGFSVEILAWVLGFGFSLGFRSLGFGLEFRGFGRVSGFRVWFWV